MTSTIMSSMLDQSLALQELDMMSKRLSLDGVDQRNMRLPNHNGLSMPSNLETLTNLSLLSSVDPTLINYLTENLLKLKLPRSESENSVKPLSSSRYKTELCRPYKEQGYCKYGDKCQFAHGFTEVRVLQRHPKYKTELCRSFHTNGYCPYGSRCNFVHNDGDVSPASPAAASNPDQIQKAIASALASNVSAARSTQQQSAYNYQDSSNLCPMNLGSNLSYDDIVSVSSESSSNSGSMQSPIALPSSPMKGFNTALSVMTNGGDSLIRELANLSLCPNSPLNSEYSSTESDGSVDLNERSSRFLNMFNDGTFSRFIY